MRCGMTRMVNGSPRGPQRTSVNCCGGWPVANRTCRRDAGRLGLAINRQLAVAIIPEAGYDRWKSYRWRTLGRRRRQIGRQSGPGRYLLRSSWATRPRGWAAHLAEPGS